MTIWLLGIVIWLLFALLLGWALGTAIRRADEELARRPKNR